jgi:hypothetical protein
MAFPLKTLAPRRAIIKALAILGPEVSEAKFPFGTPSEKGAEDIIGANPQILQHIPDVEAPEDVLLGEPLMKSR